MDNKAFGNRLKNIRVDHDKKQDDLAKLLGVSRANISCYELGKVAPPYEKIKMIADYFNTTVKYLTEGTANEDQGIDIIEELNIVIEKIKTSNVCINGKEIGDENKKFLINNIENMINMAKILFK